MTVTGGKMKILGIMGSPRKMGNTEILLDVSLEEIKNSGMTVTKISLRGKKIASCTGCEKCHETGRCVIKDDMEEIYQEMLESKGIIWATPVYFWSMSSLAKTAMDRTYALNYPKLQLASKVGGAIVVARARGCMNTANLFNMYFSYNHMFFADFTWGYAGGRGDVKKNIAAMSTAKEMGRQMVSLIRAGLKYPEEFDKPMPRFIRNKYHLD